MSDQPTTIRALVAPMITHLAAAIPVRGRWTFTELLIGAAVTVGGHITDAIVAAGHSRAWITYFWFVEPARWSWLALWAALLALRGRRCWRCVGGAAGAAWAALLALLKQRFS